MSLWSNELAFNANTVEIMFGNCNEILAYIVCDGPPHRFRCIVNAKLSSLLPLLVQ